MHNIWRLGLRRWSRQMLQNHLGQTFYIPQIARERKTPLGILTESSRDRLMTCRVRHNLILFAYEYILKRLRPLFIR